MPTHARLIVQGFCAFGARYRKSGAHSGFGRCFSDVSGSRRLSENTRVGGPPSHPGPMGLSISNELIRGRLASPSTQSSMPHAYAG
jgi:hypothetical protein